MTATTTVAQPAAAATQTKRWTQLIIAIICMVLIANLQYGWTFFVNPMSQGAWLVESIDPVCLQYFRRPGNVADAD